MGIWREGGWLGTRQIEAKFERLGPSYEDIEAVAGHSTGSHPGGSQDMVMSFRHAAFRGG